MGVDRRWDTLIRLDSRAGIELVQVWDKIKERVDAV